MYLHAIYILYICPCIGCSKRLYFLPILVGNIEGKGGGGEEKGPQNCNIPENPSNANKPMTFLF